MKNGNFTLEWLFYEMSSILLKERGQFVYTGMEPYKDYFAVMDEKKANAWEKDYPPHCKRTPCFITDYRIDDDRWVQISIEFDESLVYLGEDGNIVFNEKCKMFAIRVRDDDGYPELSNTFDLSEDGIWICGHETCHYRAGGGNYSLPRLTVRSANSFLDMMLEERHMHHRLVELSEKEYSRAEIRIVDDRIS